MATEFQEYLAVLKASYDYEPQSEDEIEVKENQILFLLEKVDKDWWKVKIKGESQDEDSPVGLIPAAYVEPADHTSVVKVLYDYDANALGEISVKEDEVLLVFDTEDNWLLVQSPNEGGKAGFVPGNYVKAFGDGDEVQSSFAPQIIVPPSPSRPVSTYVDPAVLVAFSKVKVEDVKTWSVSEVDKKGKKKKGTLGIGNGAVFFASESDKTPVQKWQTLDIEHTYIEKSKHVHIDVGGAAPIKLHFNAGSKETADVIIAKLESSRELSTLAQSPKQPIVDDHDLDSLAQLPPITSIDISHKSGKKSGASVHFSQSSPAIIPPREPSDDAEEEEPKIELAVVNGKHELRNGDKETAIVLYDFIGDSEDELTMTEGECLVVLEKDNDDWWRCRNTRGAEGVVPSSFIELSAGADASPHTMPLLSTRLEEEQEQEKNSEAEARDAKARAATEAEESAQVQRLDAHHQDEEQARALKEHKKREEEQHAKAGPLSAELQRHKRKEAAAAYTKAPEKSAAPTVTHGSSQGTETKKPNTNGESSNSARASTDNSRPPPERTRVWHDRSGQFRVEAAFLGFNGGKLRLHKANGVIVEVPSQKMSVEDMRYVEKMINKQPRSSSSAPGPRVSDDDVPLAFSSRNSTNRSTPQPKKGQTIDWFEFFLSAGCDLDDCTRYASAFERDKIDEAILPDITDATMRSLGLREGDIIRVTKIVEKRKSLSEQLPRDDRPIKIGSSAKPPNLFVGPGGVLKNNNIRRGRPQPSKSLRAPSVDLDGISGTSDQIKRTDSPHPVASPVSVPFSTALVHSPRPGSALTPSGFDDDAWINRPSSTKPMTPTLPITSPRAPSVPPPSAALPAPPPAPKSPQASTTQKPVGGLATATEFDIFEQLARLSQLNDLKRSTPVASPLPPSFSASPSTITSPASYQADLGMGSSPMPMAQHLQNQPIGFITQPPRNQPFNGPQGPFAPVLSNQGLLQPLIPTQTGFNNFIPTRLVGSSSFQPPPSFLSQEPTGFPTASQPMLPHRRGMPFGQFHSSGSLSSNGFSEPQSVPTGLDAGFGQGQTDPTNLSFGSGQVQRFDQSLFNNGLLSPPPVPPLPSNTSPANIFAQMKSGTFAAGHNNHTPHATDNYEAFQASPVTALASHSTGWSGYQGGYPGFQH